MLVMRDNGARGSMVKALAAEVRGGTAGSEVREQEVRATGGGVAAEFDVHSIGAAIARALDPDTGGQSRPCVPAATAEAFAGVLLGKGAVPRSSTTNEW